MLEQGKLPGFNRSAAVVSSHPRCVVGPTVTSLTLAALSYLGQCLLWASDGALLMKVSSHMVWSWFEHGVSPVGWHRVRARKPPDPHSCVFFAESAELPRFRLPMERQVGQ